MSENIIDIILLHIKNIEETDSILEKNIEMTKLMDNILVYKKFITNDYILKAISNKLKQLCIEPPLYSLESEWKGANYYHYNIFNEHICSKKILDTYKNYNWNIDIIHTFIPVISEKIGSEKILLQFFNLFRDKINNFEKLNKIKQFIKNQSKYLFFSPPIFNNFDNNPWVSTSISKHGIMSLEISQMNMNNLSLTDILESLDIKTKETLELISNNLYENTGKKFNLQPMNFGNGYILSKDDDSLLDSFIQNNNNIDQYKINLDSSGFYDVYIRLPKNIYKNNSYLYRLQNIKALYKLQLLEPLIIASYSSCDIRSTIDNSKYAEGSYSIISNISQNNKLNQKNDLLENPNFLDYTVTDIYDSQKIKNVSQYRIVYNKDKIDSIHLKLWDNLQHKHLKNLLKILILICTSECKLETVSNHAENDIWIKTMTECIIHGWNSEISPKFIEYISKNLCIDLYNNSKYSYNILEEVIEKLYKKALINPDNLYWKMVWDKPLIENKPEVDNINKLSWNNAFTNKKNYEEIFNNINKLFVTDKEYSLDEIKLLVEKEIIEDIHDILEYMVVNNIIKKRYIGTIIKYSKI